MSASSEPQYDKRTGKVRKVGRRKRRNKQLKPIISTDQVFLTQSDASESYAPLNLTMTKTENEGNEETSVFEDNDCPELVIGEKASIPATTDLNNNYTTSTSSECYSLKHKKFRKRSYMSSTSSVSDCCNSSVFCENDQSVEGDASGEKLKNLPIKKRRKYLGNGDDSSHSGESHRRNEDELLSGNMNSVGYEQRLSKPKSHENVKKTQFTAIFSEFSQFSANYSNNNKDGEIWLQGVNKPVVKSQQSRQVKRRPSCQKMSKTQQNYYSDKDGNANLKSGWLSNRQIPNASDSSPRVCQNMNSPLRESAAIDSSKCSLVNVSKTHNDKMSVTKIKTESHLDIGPSKAKRQGQMIKNMSVDEQKNCASRKDGFYQKRKTSEATCFQCVHSNAHAYKVTGAFTRNIIKPCESFHRNQHERKFDWRLNFNERGFNYLSHSQNSNSFSENLGLSPVQGSFCKFSNNCYAEAGPNPSLLVSNNCPSRTRSKLKYERNIDKYQAICAAGPDMAEGNDA